MHIHKFEFGYFQENTYILWDDTCECVIIDPGNTNTSEDIELFDFIEKMKLKPLRLLLTHGHIDHIAGNDAVFTRYGLLPEVHQEDLFLIQAHELTAKMYGIPCVPSPLPQKFLKEGDIIKFGNSELYCLHTPGHSPGSITYYCPKENFAIVGDVLFYESIGRTDLPKGDFETLKQSIQKKIIHTSS
ncbi:MAG: MBL fold hydrolase [Bacteroidia bacterium]|nr:MAG: MBL fold hydrolase [Bacteroidia bacterium]